MSELTKFQKAELGKALKVRGIPTTEYVFAEKKNGTFSPADVFTNRNTNESFAIQLSKDGTGNFNIRHAVPGTSREEEYGQISWSSVFSSWQGWVSNVKRESEAVDPWQQTAEDMANDDSLFTAVELPKVDRAIEASLETLKAKATEHGIAQERIEAELGEIKSLLMKTARTSTKKEWMAIFKGAVVSKILEWGMETALFQGILHVLINASQDVAQLAEHASKLIL